MDHRLPLDQTRSIKLVLTMKARLINRSPSLWSQIQLEKGEMILIFTTHRAIRCGRRSRRGARRPVERGL
jgi:hypothetical protein